MPGTRNRSVKSPPVRPAYQSPADRVRQPHRGLFVSTYFLRYWLPILGAPLASLILVLRDMASGSDDDSWWTCEPTQEELAARIGVRNRKTVMALLRHPMASVFIRREPRAGRDPVTGRYRRMADRFLVLMHDPLLPTHEARAAVAEAELILEPPPGFPQAESELRTKSCESPAGSMSDARTYTCEPPVEPTGPDAGKRTAIGGPPAGQHAGLDASAMHTEAAALTGLLEQGVSEQVARDLVRRYGPARVLRQLQYLPLRRGLENPAGALVRAVEQDWPAPGSRGPAAPPAGGWRSSRREDVARRRDEEERNRALLSEFASLPGAARDALLREARERAKAQWPSREIPVPEGLVRACLVEMLKERGREGEPQDTSPPAVRPPSDKAVEVFVRWFERRSGVAVRTGSRSRAAVNARHVCWLSLRLSPFCPSYPQIARAFGVDHTTVLYGVRRAAADPSLRAMAESWARQFRRALEELEGLPD